MRLKIMQNKSTNIDAMHNVREALQVHVDAITDITRGIHYSIDPHIHEFANKIQQIKLPTISLEWQSAIHKMAEQCHHISQSFNNIDWEKIDSILVRYTELLIELKLPPLHEIAFSKIKKIVSMNDPQAACALLINHMVRAYDGEKIEKILEKWKTLSVATTRIHIFEEVIWAHQNKKYYIAIPALIAQFEGLICDIIDAQGIRLDDVLKSHINVILNSDKKYEIANIAKEFWINVLLDNYQNKERFLSRHAIFHGQDTKYGNYEKSLILIITMDSILEWLENISKDVIERSKFEAEKIIQKKSVKNKRIN